MRTGGRYFAAPSLDALPRLGLLPLYGKALIGRHAQMHDASLAMRQNQFDVDAHLIAQPEMGDGLLSGAIAVACGDLAAAEQALRPARRAGLVHVHLRSDSHP